MKIQKIKKLFPSQAEETAAAIPKISAQASESTDPDDLSSASEQALAAIVQQISAQTTLTQKRYRIGNRELERPEISELIKAAAFLRAEIRRQKGSKPFGRCIHIRFS